MRLIPVVLLAGFAAAGYGQQQPNVEAQREAMKKLSFLVGRWSGEALISRGPGEPMKLTQTEDVQYKLDGLVLLVEGASRNAGGQVVFRALASIAYDDKAGVYRFRAYNEGRYLDTELKVIPNGFSWGFEAGPVKVTNAMHLGDKGEWIETAETAFGPNPPRRTVELRLQKQP